MVFNKIKAKCGKVHLITIFNMANSSFQGKDFMYRRMKALD
jgi:hypothetical protein